MVNVSSPSSQGKVPRIKVTGMPGKHVPSGFLGAANDFLQAVRVSFGQIDIYEVSGPPLTCEKVPPTNGWMVELGYGNPQDESDGGFDCGYRCVTHTTPISPSQLSSPSYSPAHTLLQ